MPLGSIDTVPMSASLRALVRRGVPQRLKKGVQIITEGDRGDTLYVVLEGRLRSFSANAEGQEVTYATYGPGEYVGEMGLDGGLRSANVETLEPTRCVLITRPTLEQHLRDDPAFAFELLAKVIRLARRATKGLRQIALDNVYGRLKDKIESEAQPQPDGSGVWEGLPSQQALASELGCSRPMVSRVMKDLADGGYVRVERGRLQVLRPIPSRW
jgi:CRP/FNR family transcriptional regulator, cyclic AMP receptor protein